MTVGWILEGDRDRFLSVRDITPEPWIVSPSFCCPFCRATFQRRDLFNLHIQQSHIVRRPFLLLGGVEPGSEEVIRTVLRSVPVETFNCTDLFAGFDGDGVKPIDVTALFERLAERRRATVFLRLLNASDGHIEPVAQEYRLRIVAPDEASLAKMDELFLASLAVKGIDLDTIGRFYESVRGEVAEEYAEALADYVRAVLLKDSDPSTGVSNRQHDYRGVQGRALNVLQSFERPLAKLLCALIRFNLNDFSRWSETTGFPKLDSVYAILGPMVQAHMRISRPAVSQERQGMTAVFECPVDDGTETVTLLAKQSLGLSRWGAAAEERFSVLAEGSKVDSLDRVKIRALWAVAALRLGAEASAKRALRLLDGDPTFGPWAANELVRGAFRE